MLSQPPGILIYRMIVSMHPTNWGRTFAISILVLVRWKLCGGGTTSDGSIVGVPSTRASSYGRTDPMHLHGWTVQWSHRLWCRLHSVFTARVQAREIAIHRTLLCVAMLHGWTHRMSTDTHPSSDHWPLSLTWVITCEAFTRISMPLWTEGCSFSSYLYARLNFFAYQCSIYFRKQTKFALKLFLFLRFVHFKQSIYKVINKLILLINSRPHSSTYRY
jgi:hypothetical protein